MPVLAVAVTLPLSMRLPVPLTMSTGRCLRHRLGRIARQFHLAAFAQSVGTASDHDFAHLKSIGHGDALAFGRAGLDVAHRHGLVGPDDVHEQAARTTFERRGRNDDRVVHHVEQQADVDELIREQTLVVVGKLGLGNVCNTGSAGGGSGTTLDSGGTPGGIGAGASMLGVGGATGNTSGAEIRQSLFGVGAGNAFVLSLSPLFGPVGSV